MPIRLRVESFRLAGGEWGVDAVYGDGTREAVASFVGPYAKDDCERLMRALDG